METLKLISNRIPQLVALIIVITLAVYLRLPNKEKNGHNICFGTRAGYYLTDESYWCCFSCDGEKEYRTKISPKEYKVISKVMKRMTIHDINEPYHIGANSLMETTTGTDSTQVGTDEIYERPAIGFPNADTKYYVGYHAIKNIPTGNTYDSIGLKDPNKHH